MHVIDHPTLHEHSFFQAVDGYSLERDGFPRGWDAIAWSVVSSQQSPAYHDTVPFREQVVDYIVRIRKRREYTGIEPTEAFWTGRAVFRSIMRSTQWRNSIIDERPVPVNKHIFVEAANQRLIRCFQLLWQQIMYHRLLPPSACFTSDMTDLCARNSAELSTDQTA